MWYALYSSFLLSKLVQITDHRQSEKAKALIVKTLFYGKSNLVDGINIRLIHWLWNCAILHSACNCRISMIYTCKYCNNLWKNKSNSGKNFVWKLFVEIALLCIISTFGCLNGNNLSIFLQNLPLEMEVAPRYTLFKNELLHTFLIFP